MIIFPRAQKQLFFGLKILKIFDADPESGMEKLRSGIRHKNPGSATLLHRYKVEGRPYVFSD
jgi:hypothetical protein